MGEPQDSRVAQSKGRRVGGTRINSHSYKPTLVLDTLLLQLGLIFILVLPLRQLRLIKFKQVVPGHTASSCREWAYIEICLALESLTMTLIRQKRHGLSTLVTKMTPKLLGLQLRGWICIYVCGFVTVTGCARGWIQWSVTVDRRLCQSLGELEDESWCGIS